MPDAADAADADFMQLALTQAQHAWALGEVPVRAVVVSGAGGKAFVSGADISKFERERANMEAQKKYDAISGQSYDLLYNFPKPTIAMPPKVNSQWAATADTKSIISDIAGTSTEPRVYSWTHEG